MLFRTITSTTNYNTMDSGVSMKLSDPYTWTLYNIQLTAGQLFRFSRNSDSNHPQIGKGGFRSKAPWTVQTSGLYNVSINDDTYELTMIRYVPPVVKLVVVAPSSSSTGVSSSGYPPITNLLVCVPSQHSLCTDVYVRFKGLLYRRVVRVFCAYAVFRIMIACVSRVN